MRFRVSLRVKDRAGFRMILRVRVRFPVSLYSRGIWVESTRFIFFSSLK